MSWEVVVVRSKFARALARSAMVSWREHPTQYDIEALRANIERVGVVIRVRWALVTALALFSVVAAVLYGVVAEPRHLAEQALLPVATLGFVALYNGLYQLVYRKVGNLIYLNHAQLALDILVTTVIVYYSGGVYSWFSSMYLLFILEAAFILPRRLGVWALVGWSAACYGLVLLAVYLGWMPHVNMPFIANDLPRDATYVAVRYVWMLTLFGGAATIGTLMMRRIHERETELSESSFIDELTGLFKRTYFHRILTTEMERARRNGRPFALVLADVYRFGAFNDTFGVDVGDEALVMIGGQLRDLAREGAEHPGSEVDVACRIGGEEFALVVADMERDEGGSSIQTRALSLAEELRSRVASTLVHGASVTLGVGVALFPRDGDTPDALMDAADRMLYRASLAGGNVTMTTWEADSLSEPGS